MLNGCVKPRGAHRAHGRVRNKEPRLCTQVANPVPHKGDLLLLRLVTAPTSRAVVGGSVLAVDRSQQSASRCCSTPTTACDPLAPWSACCARSRPERARAALQPRRQARRLQGGDGALPEDRVACLTRAVEGANDGQAARIRGFLKCLLQRRSPWMAPRAGQPGARQYPPRGHPPQARFTLATGEATPCDQRRRRAW